LITLQDIKYAFRSFSYYYGSAPIGTKLPYIVGQTSGSDNFAADGKVYARKDEFTLECYFAKKDESGEESIEAVLDGLGVFWNKSETRDDDESFYLIIYSFWR
jgi:hypothetical protein